jgi:riboflavin kinase / FMN adenylyltransferase
VRVLHDLRGPADGSSRHAVTIGAYDGVHQGHRAVIDRTRREAEARGAALAVVTFDRHPASVVRPESAPKLLTTLEQKLELLDSLGVDTTYVVAFDDDRAKETAEDFVMEVLVGQLRAACVVVGADFHFGYRRGGNVELLGRMGSEHDFDTVGLELVGTGTQIISSTAIRAAVSRGDMATAAAMLGRVHELRGTVVHGDKRGRTLGFPTANVAVPTEILLPGDGIYAAWYLRPDGVRRPAAVSIGRRPTFYDSAPHSLVEAFLIDFNEDLYDEVARVQIVAHLRGEARFDTVEALVSKMQADVAEARRVLGPSG